MTTCFPSRRDNLFVVKTRIGVNLDESDCVSVQSSVRIRVSRQRVKESPRDLRGSSEGTFLVNDRS